MATKKLPKKICVRWSHYKGNDEIALEANTKPEELVDLRETCEIGVYELKKVVKAQNATSISDD